MKLLFPSVGDAAAFQAYTAQLINKENRKELRGLYSVYNEKIVLTDLRGGGLDPTNDRIDDTDEFAFIITAKNLVGIL